MLKVEENIFSYSAELEIVDSLRCKAKAMKTNFEPVICPNKVTIYFKGAERWVCKSINESIKNDLLAHTHRVVLRLLLHTECESV